MDMQMVVGRQIEEWIDRGMNGGQIDRGMSGGQIDRGMDKI